MTKDQARRRCSPRTWSFAAARALLFHDLFGLLVRHLRDAVLVLLQESLHLIFALGAVVFGHFLGLFGCIELLVAVAADVAARDLALLGRLLDAANHLLTLL